MKCSFLSPRKVPRYECLQSSPLVVLTQQDTCRKQSIRQAQCDVTPIDGYGYLWFFFSPPSWRTNYAVAPKKHSETVVWYKCTAGCQVSLDAVTHGFLYHMNRHLCYGTHLTTPWNFLKVVHLVTHH